MVLLCLASSAAAERQMTFTSIVGPSDPLFPEGETGEVVTTAVIACVSAAGLYDVSTLTVTYTPPPGVVLSGPSTYSVPAQNCLLEPQQEVELSAGVTMTREAPGLVPLRVRVNATLAATPVQDPAPASAEGFFQPTAAFVGLVQATVPATVAALQDDLAAFNMSFTNQGNAASEVLMSVLESPPGLVVEIPPPLLLAAPGSGSEDHGVQTVRVHGDVDEEAVIVIAVTPVAFLDPNQQGETQSISLLVRPEPSVRDAAGPGWAAAPLLALAAAFARRRAL